MNTQIFENQDCSRMDRVLHHDHNSTLLLRASSVPEHGQSDAVKDCLSSIKRHSEVFTHLWCYKNTLYKASLQHYLLEMFSAVLKWFASKKSRSASTKCFIYLHLQHRFTNALPQFCCFHDIGQLMSKDATIKLSLVWAVAYDGICLIIIVYFYSDSAQLKVIAPEWASS